MFFLFCVVVCLVFLLCFCFGLVLGRRTLADLRILCDCWQPHACNKCGLRRMGDKSVVPCPGLQRESGLLQVFPDKASQARQRFFARVLLPVIAENAKVSH